ncbi:hypothetical protein HETIRDRAFT_106579, partial [Heterobasidion irregulare TC 32-1]
MEAEARVLDATWMGRRGRILGDPADWTIASRLARAAPTGTEAEGVAHPSTHHPAELAAPDRDYLTRPWPSPPDNLDRTALAALARTSKALRALCVPALFRTVSLPSLAALLAFLAHVPPAYRTHIRALDISTRALASP